MNALAKKIETTFIPGTGETPTKHDKFCNLCLMNNVCPGGDGCSEKEIIKSKQKRCPDCDSIIFLREHDPAHYHCDACNKGINVTRVWKFKQANIRPPEEISLGD